MTTDEDRILATIRMAADRMARLERENARLRAVADAAARANTDLDALAEMARRALRGEGAEVPA
jgi:hypothetical protein